MKSSEAGVSHENEDLELVEVPLQEALALIASGEIADVKTIALIQ